MRHLNRILGLLALTLMTAFAAAQEAEPFESEGVVAVYLDADGAFVEITEQDLTPERFVFFAWMQDLEGGIAPATGAPARPTQEERTETAPSRTQNLVAGFVGFVDDDGTVRPVSGAEVRWMIDPHWQDAQGSMVFGAVDAGGEAPVAGDLGVDNFQAVTLTNSASVTNRAQFPLDRRFPLYNATGITDPDTGGFTWITLFSPDAQARGRVIAVASVNGVEIGKEVLVKRFAPSPELAIEKTVSTSSVNLGLEGSATVQFDVTVRNVGEGDATGVTIRDDLTSGSAEAYSIVQEGIGDTAELVESDDDGFVVRFDLPAGQERSFTFQSQVTETDTYCNTAAVTEYGSEFDAGRRTTPSAQACFEATRPELTVLKDFVTENGESLGDNVEASADQPVLLRVRVMNQGDAPAEGLTLTDTLEEGDAESYSIVEVPEGATQEGQDGLSADIGTLGSGEQFSLLYPVQASADGQYCDVVVLNANGEALGQDRACLIVATPDLTIVKTNDIDTVLPGSSYESTVTVTNEGNAVARDVVIADVIGTVQDGDLLLVYVSSSFDNASGVFDPELGRVDAPETFDLEPGESATLNVTTRVPQGTTSGTFCDVGLYESDNAGSGEVEACIEVPAYAALQTRLVDSADPVITGSEIVYTSTMFNEPRSNEAVVDNRIAFTFGGEENVQAGEAGTFELVATRVLYNGSPLRDPSTGAIVSTADSGTELTEGEDYEITTSESGLQVITLSEALPPNSAVFVVHEVNVPEGVPAGSYTTNFTWTAVGADSGTEYNPQGAEPTTAIVR